MRKINNFLLIKLLKLLSLQTQIISEVLLIILKLMNFLFFILIFAPLFLPFLENIKQIHAKAINNNMTLTKILILFRILIKNIF